MSTNHFFLLALTLLFSITLSGQSKQSVQASARDVARYDTIGPFEIGGEPGFEKDEKALGQIRAFIWEHWNGQKRGWLSATFYTIEGDKTTSKFFVEPDQKGAWRLIIDSESIVSARSPKRQRPKHTLRHEVYDQLDWVERTCNLSERCRSVTEQAVQDPPRYLLLLINRKIRASQML